MAKEQDDFTDLFNDDFDLESLETYNEGEEGEQKEEVVSLGSEEAELLNRRLDFVEREIKARGLGEFFRLRSIWSNWIIGWISVLVLFNGALTVSVGLGFLNFEKYHWFITAVTVETFLQIVGMGVVAVKFLFSEAKVG